MASWHHDRRDRRQQRLEPATSVRTFLVVFAGSLGITVILMLLAAAQQ